MKEEKLSFKCELFFGKNWKYIFWGLIIAILVIAYELNAITGQINHLEKVVYDNNSKVVLTTTDGRAIKVVKTPLKAEYLKQNAISLFVNNFIVSRSMITENFNNTNIQTYKDILENSKSLGKVYLHYIDRKDKQSLGQFISYLQWIISAVARNKLPEYINIKDYKVNVFEYNGNAFKLDLMIKVASQSYILAKGKYRSENGQVKIVAEGDFDLSRSVDENPYGMQIKNFQIEMVTKAES